MDRVALRKRALVWRKQAEARKRAEAVAHALYEADTEAEEEDEDEDEGPKLSLDDAASNKVNISQLMVREHTESQLAARRAVRVCPLCLHIVYSMTN
jgi:hypothetical protein